MSDVEVFTPRFNQTVQLTGTDGNAWAIMAKVTSALRDAGATKDQEKEYLDEAMDGDYDNLLRVSMRWVHVV